ncbi:MAG: 30S ribosomal protein S8 [Candidatus Nanoarchaeia archaeon]
MKHDVLADALCALKNVKEKGQKEVIVRPISKLVIKIFEILKKEGYIEAFEIFTDKRGGHARIILSNLINDIGVIKPRFSATLEEFEKFEKRYLPAKDFGRLIVSTSKGIMTHLDAKAANQGGVLLAYVY